MQNAPVGPSLLADTHLSRVFVDDPRLCSETTGSYRRRSLAIALVFSPLMLRPHRGTYFDIDERRALCLMPPLHVVLPTASSMALEAHPYPDEVVNQNREDAPYTLLPPEDVRLSTRPDSWARHPRPV